MKKIFNWQLLLGAGLLALSALVYLFHYALFRDAHHIFIYLIGDVAFVPIEVLLVTLIIHRLLNVREKRAMLRKLNMVIGVFYNEVGADLLRAISAFDPEVAALRRELDVKTGWKHEDFVAVKERLLKRDVKLAPKTDELIALKAFLVQKQGLLLRMLENPSLLEHGEFTDLLWAVFHLADELAHRDDIPGIAQTDRNHLGGDAKRAYEKLLSGWLDYMEHLRADYPYLFSLAVRTNPFNPEARPEVE